MENTEVSAEQANAVAMVSDLLNHAGVDAKDPANYKMAMQAWQTTDILISAGNEAQRNKVMGEMGLNAVEYETALNHVSSKMKSISQQLASAQQDGEDLSKKYNRRKNLNVAIGVLTSVAAAMAGLKYAFSSSQPVGKALKTAVTAVAGFFAGSFTASFATMRPVTKQITANDIEQEQITNTGTDLEQKSQAFLYQTHRELAARLLKSEIAKQAQQAKEASKANAVSDKQHATSAAQAPITKIATAEQNEQAIHEVEDKMASLNAIKDKILAKEKPATATEALAERREAETLNAQQGIG